MHPFDRLYGTDTGGLIPAAELTTGAAADRHVTAYYGVAPSILRALIDRWLRDTAPEHPIAEVTFLDIGAGKGRAMILAAENPFREVVGIELNPALATLARHNLLQAAQPLPAHSTRPGLLAPVRLVEGNALTLPLDPRPTLAFLFHPFEAAALRLFLRSVERSFAPTSAGSPRVAFDLLYVNAEHLALLERHPAFTLLWQGAVSMSTEDHLADLQEIAAQLDYGSTGDEHCAIVRYTGRTRRKGVQPGDRSL